ncbi:uncharacterized protein LOC124997592 isoform X2 [Mugil cephalus]|uniref:uncharacterized protein LOC124997592 isoform X2 n=1 Tax=Mugil cephalus TaxID=48193 RepID=UPI001FB669A6|nr:uncharacterized protein LOC124997592 isoform X2 [Mugil cephalus]
MDPTWLVVLVSAGVLLALVLLVVACLDCRNKGPMVSIRQGSASEEYIESTEFRVIHPSHPAFGLSIHSPSNALSTLRNSPDPGRRPYTPTETESNPSYENPVNGPESLDNPEGDYIIVLADNQNRPSTPCSDTLHDYENLEGTPDSKCSTPASEEENDHDYQNVNPSISKLRICPAEYFPRGPTPESSPAGDTTDEDDDDDDYDDSGNYVNQPAIIHS